MVLIDGGVCVDRYEASIADAASGRLLSPYFPVKRSYRWYLFARKKESDGLLSGRDSGLGATMPFPELPAWQRDTEVDPMAASRAGVVPHGYLTKVVAEAACRRASKRLCRLDEWRRACRGEADRRYPYGDRYRRRLCNLARGRHPGRILFGDPSASMIDPRLNLVTFDGEPLLRRTGATPRCASAWGSDRIYDMVGNLDEWVDEPGGAFAGGAYSRYTRAGCGAIVRAHPPAYWDYSTGARCCRDAGPRH